MTYYKSVNLSEDDVDAIKSYLTYYPNQNEPNITRTIVFDNRYEMDVKLCPCDEDTEPFAEAVLFHDGYEVCHTDVSDTPDLLGTWELSCEDDGETLNFIADVLPPCKNIA